MEGTPAQIPVSAQKLYTLQQFGATPVDVVSVNKVDTAVKCEKVVDKAKRSMMNPFWVYIILAVIILIILAVFRPSIVTSISAEGLYLDWFKVVMWSLGLALLLLIILGIVGLIFNPRC